jgi:hypothetical protein
VGGGAIREDDVEPEAMDDGDMALRDGEVVAMAVGSGFGPLAHAEAEAERALKAARPQAQLAMCGAWWCGVVHGDKAISASYDHTWTCEHTPEGHGEQVDVRQAMGGRGWPYRGAAGRTNIRPRFAPSYSPDCCSALPTSRTANCAVGSTDQRRYRGGKDRRTASGGWVQ